MVPASEALDRLKDGNRRFKDGLPQPSPAVSPTERVRLASGQAPFAVVLGCSDSRVPVETIFDCGPGDLFVVRVAGNVAAPTQVASIAFAVEKFGTRLVVVLGHTHCGAVGATFEVLAEDPEAELGPLLGRIRPAVAGLAAPGGGMPDEAVLREGVRANVRVVVEGVRGVIEGEGVLMVGAVYDLETGAVEFLDPG
ncbi:MAG TPA: carbonic anhydrase [Anaerolineales bacterium]|nr:carbonic anhydrase [Anaerolineales bacterium]